MKQLSKDEIAAERFALQELREAWEGSRRLVEEGLKRQGQMPGVFKLLRQDVEKILDGIKAQLDQQEEVRQIGVKLS